MTLQEGRNVMLLVLMMKCQAHVKQCTPSECFLTHQVACYLSPLDKQDTLNPKERKCLHESPTAS